MQHSNHDLRTVSAPATLGDVLKARLALPGGALLGASWPLLASAGPAMPAAKDAPEGVCIKPGVPEAALTGAGAAPALALDRGADAWSPRMPVVTVLPGQSDAGLEGRTAPP